MNKVLITGGAGFIGSHLVDRLMKEGHEVIVLDNLSNGNLDNLKAWVKNPKFRFFRGDLKDTKSIMRSLDQVELVYHFAANPEVRIGEIDPSIHFTENLKATFNLLESIRNMGTVKAIIFASTSTVYGEASKIPTQEDYGSLIPISTYGASKLGCEALICSYAYSFGFRALILRLANIIGPRSKHGVIIDFINKLKSNPKCLEILGDGSQRKSYLYIQDCIEAILIATSSFMKDGNKVQIYNVGSFDSVSVKRIADIVIDQLGLNNIKLSCTGGVNGGRGWIGDVRKMHLSINKILKAGWKPKFSSEDAIRLTVKTLGD